MSVLIAVLTALQVVFTAGMLVSFMRAALVMKERSTLRWQLTGAVFLMAMVTAPTLRVVFDADTPLPLAVFVWAVFVVVLAAMVWYISRCVRKLRTMGEGA